MANLADPDGRGNQILKDLDTQQKAALKQNDLFDWFG